MGTNFYLPDGLHIGKRSAAGLYCWDCHVTLCENGENGVHRDSSGWHRTCPVCGQARQKEMLEDSSAGRELGFNKKPFKKKFGVRSVSSFTWAVDPAILKKTKHILDEYHERYSIQKFRKMLEECPIQFHDQIGKRFS